MKNIYKKLMLSAMLTLPTLQGCSAYADTPEDFPEGFVYQGSDHDHNLDIISKEKIVDGKLDEYYDSNHIFIAVNKETYETTKYIYFDDLFNYIYDFETGYLLYQDRTYDLYAPIQIGREKNLEKIRSENYLVYLNELDNFLEGYELKDEYSLTELNKISEELSQAIKMATKKEAVLKLSHKM